MISRTRVSLPNMMIPYDEVHGLFSYADFLPQNLDLDWDNEGYIVDYTARDNWKRLREIIEEVNLLISDCRSYPFSEPFEILEYEQKDEGGIRFTKKEESEPSSPFRNRARTINALYVIQEVASAHEIIKCMQKSLLEDTLENLIYSLGVELDLTFPPSIDNLTRIASAGEYSTSSRFVTQPMAEGFKRIFGVLNGDESFSSLYKLFENVHLYAEDSYRLLNVMTKDTSECLKGLQAIVNSKRKNRNLIINLLNDRIAHVLSIKETNVRKTITFGIRCGEYTIEDKMKECYQRMKKCTLFDSFTDYPETPKGFADFIVDQISQKSNWLYENDHDRYWEFLSCVVELEFLKSIEHGTALPKPFFPKEDTEEGITAKGVDEEVSKLDKYILGLGEERQANKAIFCKGMEERKDNKAKAWFVCSQINKTISNWPSYPALKEKGLVKCSPATWSGMKGMFK